MDWNATDSKVVRGLAWLPFRSQEPRETVPASSVMDSRAMASGRIQEEGTGALYHRTESLSKRRAAAPPLPSPMLRARDTPSPTRSKVQSPHCMENGLGMWPNAQAMPAWVPPCVGPDSIRVHRGGPGCCQHDPYQRAFSVCQRMLSLPSLGKYLEKRLAGYLPT